MKLKIRKGRIVGIEDDSLNPVMPDGDLSFVEDKDLFKEIRNYVISDHNKLENKSFFQNGVMKGSNPYLAVAVDMYLKTHAPDYRIATQFDLEKDLSQFRGVYVDTGLALRRLEGENAEKAKHLFEQLKARGISPKDFPLWINLRGLELDCDLNFKLTDESRYKTAPCLNWENGTNYSKTDDFGLPKSEDESSPRQIWTSDGALVGCCLEGGSVLGSGFENPDYSNGGGRVVLAKMRSGGCCTKN